MSVRRLKAKDKTTQKISRDGLVLKNETTGESHLISKRYKDINLKNSSNNPTTYSQLGNRFNKRIKPKHIQPKHNDKTYKSKTQSKTLKERADKIGSVTGHTSTKSSKSKTPILINDRKTLIQTENPSLKIQSLTDKHNKDQIKAIIKDLSHTYSQVGNKYDSTFNTHKIDRIIKTNKLDEIIDSIKTIETTTRIVESITKCEFNNTKTTLPFEPIASQIKHKKPSKLYFPKNEKIDNKSIVDKPVSKKHAEAPQELWNIPQQLGNVPQQLGNVPQELGNVPQELGNVPQELGNAQDKLDNTKTRLHKSSKFPVKRVFDMYNEKVKNKLFFENKINPKKQHLKEAPFIHLVKSHTDVDIDNAKHIDEMIVKPGVRTALRFHKTSPYRKEERTENKTVEKTNKLNYEKLLAKTPKLSNSTISQMFQKRKINNKYAKDKREVEGTTKFAQKVGTINITATIATKSIGNAMKRHPYVAGTFVLTSLLLFLLLSLFSLFGGIGNGSLVGILTASYLSEDADIDLVELNYSQWETDLMMQIADIENNYAGFDEYRYNTGDISHNPYELMAYLTAVYQYFSYDVIQTDLKALFDEQYSLTLSETTETRYKDPDDVNEDGDYEPYDWKILMVTLNTQHFEDVINTKMTTEQRQHYEILMRTKGSRQYTGSPFATGWLPYVTSYYGYRVHPISGEKDLHRGIDIAFPKGTEIHSALDGTVTFAGVNGGYGNVVVIENDKGLVNSSISTPRERSQMVIYAHCDSIMVSVGQVVKMGDVIATVGNTGNSTGAHLHMEVLKNNQYLNPLLYVDAGSFDFTPKYASPGAAMEDGIYAALIAEAEVHLGKPYIFGSNGPNSFDCSSFICFIFSNSGVKDMPRTTAQGIYNQCTPIRESERQPGDLIFFQDTYSTTNTVTHIGLYVGDGYMIHAGSPVQYTKIDGNPYWQAHLYSYGRP